MSIPLVQDVLWYSAILSLINLKRPEIVLMAEKVLQM